MNDLRTQDRITADFLIENQGHLYRRVIECTEREIIAKTLAYTRGNKISAARILGINRNTIHCKAKKFGIEARQFK